MSNHEPRSVYLSRLAARRATYAALDARDRQVAWTRLALFATGLLLAWLSLGRGAVPLWLLGLPVVAFLALARYHASVIAGRDHATRAIAYYTRGLARLDDQWAGGGETGDRFRRDDHPYALDLDLFGRGSLFDLLSVARTRAGEETLAAWLEQAASLEELAARHEAVRELTPQLDLRESLAMAGADVRAAVLTDALTAWAGTPPLLGPWVRPVAALLSAATIATLGWWFAGGPGLPALLSVTVGALVSGLLNKAVTQVLHSSGRPVRDLDVLAHALTTLERAAPVAPRLRALQTAVTGGDGAPASQVIRRVHRLSEMHDWQHNAFFAPLAALLLWGPHLACAVEQWRAQHGARVIGWLTAVGELETLSSLATYTFEHPDDPFPELVEGPALFEATGLGHPLIPSARMVRNDVAFDRETRLYVVSGSNMSGKSTMLRTVGINTVLAMAGAPVRAVRLRLSPLALGATLRVQDSLQDGTSRFYAEISRLRDVVALTRGPLPVLFLLDELFHGTNSHDRLIGASGVLQGLLDAGAIGFVTTHDLALTAVADRLAPRAVNVHFEDRFEHGAMSFDYTMRPGPVTHSNALALMRAVGLRVPDTTGPSGTGA